MRRLLLPVLALACVGSWPVRALAHGITVNYQSTRAYEIEATYETGEPMVNAQVSVFSPENPAEPWLIGTTDAEGRFLFSPSTVGNWEVQVRQAGHGDILVIPVETVASPTDPGGAGTPVPSAVESSPTAPDAIAPPEPISSGAIATLTPLQRGIMIASVIWGCVGTALFFARGKTNAVQGTIPLERDAHS